VVDTRVTLATGTAERETALLVPAPTGSDWVPTGPWYHVGGVPQPPVPSETDRDRAAIARRATNRLASVPDGGAPYVPRPRQIGVRYKLVSIRCSGSISGPIWPAGHVLIYILEPPPDPSRISDLFRSLRAQW
jgi:hypothetical protein